MFTTVIAGLTENNTLPVQSFAQESWSIHREKDRCYAEFTLPENGQIRLKIEQAVGQYASLTLDVPEVRYRGRLVKQPTIAFHHFAAAHEAKGTQPSLIVKTAKWTQVNDRSRTTLDAQQVDFAYLANDLRITDERGRQLVTTNIRFLRDASYWVGYCAGWSARHNVGTGKAAAIQPRLKPQGAGRPPDYPSRALREDRRGVSVVNATVTATGNVSACDVKHSSGSLDLNLAACQSIARLEFEPGKDADGLPTISYVSRRFVWAIP